MFTQQLFESIHRVSPKRLKVSGFGCQVSGVAPAPLWLSTLLKAAGVVSIWLKKSKGQDEGQAGTWIATKAGYALRVVD